MILILFVASIPTILAEDISYGTIVVDGTTSIAQTDDNFVCATIDWWPHDKCDYKQCPWHYTSTITLVRFLLKRLIFLFEFIVFCYVTRI